MARHNMDDAAEIRKMAEVADQLARKINRRFVLDERKVEAYEMHNRRKHVTVAIDAVAAAVQEEAASVV